MKKTIGLAFAVLLFAASAIADTDDNRGGPGRGPGMWGRGWGMGPGWSDDGGWGPGMMDGWGPGMMGGWGMGGFGWDWDDYAQIPQDKRAKLRELAVETQKKMFAQMAAMHELMLASRQALFQFPLDKAAATKAREGLNSIRKQMFDIRLDAMAKAQDILGKELWTQLCGTAVCVRGPGRR